jgi:surfactin synthase thioesterase subunit
MAAIIEESSLWIRRFHAVEDAGARLVCFPHAGGSATFYFPLSRALAPAAEVVAVQYPGRQDRRAERCLDDLGELVDAVMNDLQAWFDRPVALFGHSMGATVAYEVARRLERDGTQVLGLFASACRAPSEQRVENVHQRDEEGLIAALRELSGTDPGVLDDAELLRMVLPAVRGDYKAVETYRHQPGTELSCPIRVLVGDNDPVTDLSEASAWQAHTTSTCEMDVFPGGHFYLNAQIDKVLTTIERQLTQWSANRSLESQ